MKTNIILSSTALLAASLIAADSNPRQEIMNAAEKLGEKANYSWKTTVVVPEDAQFRPGPTEGKTEKDGFTYLSMIFAGNPTLAVLKGDKAAITDRDGDWQSASDLESSEGRGRFLGRMVRNIKTPAVQAAELAAASKDLKKDGNLFSGDLTEEGAKAQMRLGTAKNAKGSVKFWLKDGALSKYEFKVKGTMDLNGNDVDVDRNTTVEIKDVGTTKVVVPEEAKKKLS